MSSKNKIVILPIKEEDDSSYGVELPVDNDVSSWTDAQPPNDAWHWTDPSYVQFPSIKDDSSYGVELPTSSDVSSSYLQPFPPAEQDDTVTFIFNFEMFVPFKFPVGLEFSYNPADKESAITVIRVLPGGMIDSWNYLCFNLDPPVQGPEKAVCPGDLIASVNGYIGMDAIRCLQRRRLLKFTITRREPASLYSVHSLQSV